MKNYNNRSSFDLFSALALAAFLWCADSAKAQTMVFSTFVEKAPIVLISEAVITQAYKELGIPISIVFLPTERSLQMSNTGKVDGELFRNYDLSKTRYPNLLRVEVPIARVKVVVFTKRKDVVIKSWADFGPYVIGVMRGFKLIEDRTQGLKTENVDTIDQTFLMLNLGRVDVVVQEQSAGMQSIHRLKLSGITVLDPPLEEIPVYHYLNKKHSNLLPRITKKLLAMKKSGEIDRIQLRVVEQF